MTHLFKMLRDMDHLTNEVGGIIRIYRDQKEKARFGVAHAREEEAVKIIERFFKPERVFKRVQILYDHKCRTEGKYKHLSIFGFYLQLKPYAKLLNGI